MLIVVILDCTAAVLLVVYLLNVSPPGTAVLAYLVMKKGRPAGGAYLHMRSRRAGLAAKRKAPAIGVDSLVGLPTDADLLYLYTRNRSSPSLH